MQDQPISPRAGAATQLYVCWVELDRAALLIYEYADGPPLVWFPTGDIHSVSPTSLGLDNSAFEIQVLAKHELHPCACVTDFWVVNGPRSYGLRIPSVSVA